MHEILTLIIIIGSCFQVKNDSVAINMVNFTGYAEGPYFRGRILPGAVDTQTIASDGTVRLSARYMLEGVDCQGDSCRMYISNEAGGDTPNGYTRPTIVSDSKYLFMMATGQLIGRIDATADSLVIRIYSEGEQ